LGKMTMNGDLLLHSPVEYFRDFERRGASMWIALAAFFIVALAEAVAVGELPKPSEVPQVLMWVVLNWVLGVLFFGVLWFFVGARVLGGKASLGTTVRAVGYAFLLPGTLALAVTLLTAPLGKMAAVGALGLGAVKVALGVWSLCLAGIAVGFAHKLTWLRAVFVVLWMPAVWLVVAAMIVLAVPFFTVMRAG
jgi:hypothetical protein